MKPTSGFAEVFAYKRTSEEAEAIGVTIKGGDIADCSMNSSRSFDERKANAELIANAFNTHHTTGLTPSELEAQLSELKACLLYTSPSPRDRG